MVEYGSWTAGFAFLEVKGAVFYVF
jgi:hypothetical protein